MNTCEKLFSLAKFCFFSLGRDGARWGGMGRDGARRVRHGITGCDRARQGATVLKSRLRSMGICRDT